MSLAEPLAGPAVCPGCCGSAGAVRVSEPSRDETPALQLSLPGLRCAGCISAVERGLLALPEVRSARVNLSLKRVTIDAEDGFTATMAKERLAEIGYAAQELDGDALAACGEDPEGHELLMRFAVAGFAQMNVMLLSVAVWSGAEDATRDMFHWISAAITVPTVVFAGQPFFRSAVTALARSRLNMDVPISLAILLAVAVSLWETAQSGDHAYFDAALSLTFFLLAGRYLDHRTRSAARSAAQELAALEVPRATKLVGGVPVEVRTSDLSPGDLVAVFPGSRIPVDGHIVSGSSELDRAAMTGETMPVQVGAGDGVRAGEMNLTGVLNVAVEAAGAGTALAQLAGLVAVAESGRARYSGLADRAARAYAPVVHVLALGAFLAWVWGSGDVRLALNIAVAVLIITCPCALGLAVPAVTTAASGRLFRRGVLIKSATALERLAKVDTVVFDKTGTLTLGDFRADLDAMNDPEDRALALGLAEGSAHPMARALAAALREDGVVPAQIEDLRERPGYGVEGRHGGELLRLGRAAWAGVADSKGTATWFARAGREPVRIGLSDRLRPEAAAVVAGFAARGLKQVLLSGDGAEPVRRLAAEVGLAEFHAEMTPEAKEEHIRGLRAEGRTVLMVGDGLNDTAALMAADVSVSPASAVEAARVASDIVLLQPGFGTLPEIYDTARSATRRIKENFAISAAYNLVAVPVALLGFATPLLAALAMSASSISVTLNAMRVR